MAQSSATFHESTDLLKPETMDRHRAIVSLMEELEAVDWYDQRVDATNDAELAEVLAHNRDEEKEHAAMTLEWLRRRDPILDEHLRTYLFTEGNIVESEEVAMSGDDDGGADPADHGSTTTSSLGIGGLRHHAHNATPAIGGLL